MKKIMHTLVEIKRSNHSLCSYIKQDPIHLCRDSGGLSHRFAESQRIYAYVNDENYPIIICCVKLSSKPIENMSDIFGSSVSDIVDTSGKKRTTITFYSIFRTNIGCSEMGKDLGFSLITDVTELLCKEFNTIKYVRTLSPIPSLHEHFTVLVNESQVLEYINKKMDPVAKFHLRNKAKVFKVVDKADQNDIRLEQSYGWMAIYDYSNYFFPPEEKQTEDLSKKI